LPLGILLNRETFAANRKLNVDLEIGVLRLAGSLTLILDPHELRRVDRQDVGGSCKKTPWPKSNVERPLGRVRRIRL
jgi:hypothetical protein